MCEMHLGRICKRDGAPDKTVCSAMISLRLMEKI